MVTHETDKVFCCRVVQVVPLQVLSLLTWQELELIICGRATIDLELLRRNTQYAQGLSPDDPVVGFLWRVLESFNHETRRKFIRFAWAQDRLPADDHEFKRNHTRMLVRASTAPGPPDARFPRADTCFFNVEMPRFSSEAILREKLLYALQTTTMNADEAPQDEPQREER